MHRLASRILRGKGGCLTLGMNFCRPQKFSRAHAYGHSAVCEAVWRDGTSLRNQ